MLARWPVGAWWFVGGLVLAVYASGGSWKWFWFALPQAWTVVAMLLTLTTRASPRGGAERRLRWSTLLMMGVQQAAYMADHQRGDMVVLTGWLTLLIGLDLVESAPARLAKALRRLRDREVLRGPFDELESDLARTGGVAALAGAWIVAVVLMVTWPRAHDVPASWRHWAFGPAVLDQALIVVAGAVVGTWLGQMTGYGRIGGAIVRLGLRLRLVPGHPDGAAGFKPIGDFYLYQFLIASVPAGFLAIWVLVLSLGGRLSALAHYQPFLDQYLWLLAIAILAAIAAFVLPLRSLHVLMQTRKEEDLLTLADQMVLPAIEVEKNRSQSLTPEEHDAAERRLAVLTNRYRELDATPTWPIDTSILRRFALTNAGLLTPFVSYALTNWQQVQQLFSRRG